MDCIYLSRLGEMGEGERGESGSELRIIDVLLLIV